MKEDLTGKRFGRLLVLGPEPECKGKYICQCDCGNVRLVFGHNLRRGASTSCGCSRIHHGKTGTPLYLVWSNIRKRVRENPSIQLCKEWEEDFQNFQDWALDNGYSEDTALRRKDKRGGYTPENCEWREKRPAAPKAKDPFNLPVEFPEEELRKLREEMGIPDDPTVVSLKDYLPKR